MTLLTPEHPWCLRTTAWNWGADATGGNTDIVLWDFSDDHLLTGVQMSCSWRRSAALHVATSFLISLVFRTGQLAYSATGHSLTAPSNTL